MKAKVIITNKTNDVYLVALYTIFKVTVSLRRAVMFPDKGFLPDSKQQALGLLSKI